jgi:small conductance mechanosensitive channel
MRWVAIISVVAWFALLAAPCARADTADTRPATTTQPAAFVRPPIYHTSLIKAMKGEKELMVEDLFDRRFWDQSAWDLLAEIVVFVPRLLVAAILFGIFWLIYRAARRIALGSMQKGHVDSSIRDMLLGLVKWAILGFGLVMALNQIGIQIAALLTGVSIIGLAIGFAAQETLSNFIAGVVIFWDRPFKAGDWITIDGQFGQVQRVSFRSTRVLNSDGEVVIMPNTAMLNNRLHNHSTHPVNRLNVPIGIAYKESIDKARFVLLGCCEGDSRIAKDPPPTVAVQECAASSVNLLLRFWITDQSIELKMINEYQEKAKKALDAAGIEIPFPHVQLLVEQPAPIEAPPGAGNGKSKVVEPEIQSLSS